MEQLRHVSWLQSQLAKHPGQGDKGKELGQIEQDWSRKKINPEKKKKIVNVVTNEKSQMEDKNNYLGLTLLWYKPLSTLDKDLGLNENGQE